MLKKDILMVLIFGGTCIVEILPFPIRVLSCLQVKPGEFYALVSPNVYNEIIGSEHEKKIIR